MEFQSPRETYSHTHTVWVMVAIILPESHGLFL